MKTLLLTALLTSGTALVAQITITAEDLPASGADYTYMNASDLSGNDPEDTGTDFTWDYSGIQDLLPVNESYVAVSEAPITYQFLFNNPGIPDYLATMSIERLNQQIGDQITVDDFYEFLRADESVYARLGAGLNLSGFPLVARYEPIDTLLRLPANYGDTGGGYSEFFVEVPFLGTYLSKQTRSYEIDGWGTVITPYGSFEALRVKTLLEVRDSISIPGFGIDQAFDRPLATEYAWYAPGEGIPVLRINSVAGFDVTTQYKTTYIPAGIEESIHAPLSVWPVPAQESINVNGFSGEPGTTWQIIDNQGKLISTGLLVDAGRLFIDVGNLSSGVYTLVIRGEKGIQSRQFVKE